MNPRQRKQFDRQLAAQVEAISNLPEEELPVSILDICCGILSAVPNTMDIKSIDSERFAALCAGYASMSESIGAFQKQAAERLQEKGTSLKEPLEASAAALNAAEEELTAQRSALAENKQALEEARLENEALEKAVAGSKAALQAEAERREHLEAYEKEVGEEVREKLREENAALLERNIQDTAEVKALKDEQTRLESELARLGEEIASIPQRNKELLVSCEEKQEYLARLRRAETECSEEKQAEIQAEIDQLTPLVETLSSDIKILQEEINDLKQAYCHYDKERETLETNFFEVYNGKFQELKQSIGEHEETLTHYQKIWDALRASYDKCRALRRDYQSWWEADRSPLEAMEEAVRAGSQRTGRLQETLDVSKEGRLAELNDILQKSLEEYDRILQACAQAAQADYRDTYAAAIPV